MSATSGIAASQDLIQQFSSAIESHSTRFIKVSIANESLICDQTVPARSSFVEDLSLLQDLVQEDVPAYVLARLDEPQGEWLAIFYVPDSAKVRDKMLYASTRMTLLKTLGSQTFTDQIFATTKTDLTAVAYADHRKHLAAPKPLSKREQELADIKEAERQAGGGSDYQGSSVRQSPMGQRVNVQWSNEVEIALKALIEGDRCTLVILRYDLSETLTLDSVEDTTIDEIGKELPPTDPCYAFFSWPNAHGSSVREIVYIYSCPSSSPIKHRMLYSCGSVMTYNATKALVASYPGGPTLSPHKIETSDPAEINEAFLTARFGENAATPGDSGTPVEEKKMFAKPRGPARKR